ncbi:MAG TPA: L-seryl-tRNA(Sec) selenium transferase [Chloroflexota bacterium]|nr:L-seryl-tRNA(Sec) selenium transferase [Chloroflexota bacterium]
MSDTMASLRQLPSVNRLLREQQVEELSNLYSHELLVQAIRDTLQEARDAIRDGGNLPAITGLIEAVREHLEATFRPSLRPVINATGVIIHTNLGRAPLSDDALRAVRDVAAGYSNLEYRLEEGTRGSRHEHISDLVRRISGAEDALVVNNNASAVLLILSALAQGREVIVSRGQAVEIGGGFRIPDVLRQSGARLVEVGTTNRTYIRDYEEAITPETGILLYVHPSNFRVEGFVHSATIEELADLGRRLDIPVVDDLGSGSLLNSAEFGLQHEPMVQERVAAGADLVAFSGDKLLGGPQAGLIAGKAELVEKLRHHPLARALRVDKMTIAALAATLNHYLRGEALTRVPVWRMISTPIEDLESRGGRLARRLRQAGLAAETMPGLSTIGGGSLPGETLPTRLVVVSPTPDQPSAMEMAAALRGQDPPLVARLERDRLLLDLRTVPPQEDRVVADHLKNVAAR